MLPLAVDVTPKRISGAVRQRDAQLQPRLRVLKADLALAAERRRDGDVLLLRKVRLQRGGVVVVGLPVRRVRVVIQPRRADRLHPEELGQPLAGRRERWAVLFPLSLPHVVVRDQVRVVVPQLHRVVLPVRRLQLLQQLVVHRGVVLGKQIRRHDDVPHAVRPPQRRLGAVGHDQPHRGRDVLGRLLGGVALVGAVPAAFLLLALRLPAPARLRRGLARLLLLPALCLCLRLLVRHDRAGVAHVAGGEDAAAIALRLAAATLRAAAAAPSSAAPPAT